VFTAESQVGQPFELAANISYIDPGKYAIKSLSDSFEPLKVKAREVGANGVIIDDSSQVISGIITRHFRRRASDMAVDATRGSRRTSWSASRGFEGRGRSASAAAEAAPRRRDHRARVRAEEDGDLAPDVTT
jgi:hypothetical protein